MPISYNLEHRIFRAVMAVSKDKARTGGQFSLSGDLCVKTDKLSLFLRPILMSYKVLLTFFCYRFRC